MLARARWLVAALVALLAIAVSSAPASAQSSTVTSSLPQPSVSNDLGVWSIRHGSLSGHSSSALPAQQRTTLTTCAAGWRVVDSQSGSWNNFLVGIAGVSPTDMWAVGNSQSSTPTQFGNGDQNLAEHWNGWAWGIVPTPNPGADANDLNDVAAIATNDVWAVGFQNTTGFRQSEALHWDGTAWSTATVPSFGTTNLLNDVTAFPNDVWAVGRVDGDNGFGTTVKRTLILHWNRTTGWAVATSANVGSGDNELFGVGGTSTGDVWAVGYSSSTVGGPIQGLIEHWDGSAWTVATIPTFGGAVQSVAADSTTSAIAVGWSLGSNNKPVGVALRWSSGSWTNSAFSEPSVYYEVLADVVAVSSTDYWAVGFEGESINGPDQGFGAEWNGSGWTNSFMASVGSGANDAFSAAVPSTNDVWAVGAYQTPSNLAKNLIENYSGLQPPNGTPTAASGDQSATVNWVVPCADGGSAITSYVVTAYDGCTIQGSETVAAPATSTTYTGLTNGTSYTFKVAAVNGFGAGPQSAASNGVVPSGATAPGYVTACSTKQYVLTGSDGSTWMDVDVNGNLTVSFTPSVNSYAVLSANADMWTFNSGYNQDLGIAVSGGAFPTTAGQPEVWKESGGLAGTFSPNAAFAQGVIPVAMGKTYTAKLQWKASHSDPGTIAMGAGPIGSDFSPTRLTVQLVPVANATVVTKVSTSQYHLTGSDGSSWTDMDAASLSLQFMPAAGTWTAFLLGNADLWTSSSGYNQDFGITVSGAPYPTTAGQPESWKESGGSAGTFSPNAAFVEAALPVSAGSAYTAKLQWKVNQADPGTIWAGAGPIGGKFSPTSLTLILVPQAPAPQAAASSHQYPQLNSDGMYWQPVDTTSGTPLTFSFTPAAATSYQVSANADLWTTVSGYNQDVAIIASGGAYGPGTVVAWKESGGSAGTFSPNAAFVTTVLHLQMGVAYTFSVAWKANGIAKVSNAIYIGAGPIGGKYSPTWLTALPLSQP
jgi:hypothetical protein